MSATSFERLSSALSDRYRIERELGAGGMATVYLAHDLKHDRKVAIKVLKPELAAVLGADRFVVEIKTTAAMSHPHILPLFDSGTADGFLFYVMPYIEGETIRDRLNRESQLGVEEAIRIAREVADALDYAHRHGVIHRDIKPENVLLHDGRAMVMDFGIALAVSAAAGGRMTETGLSLGTPHYMSPEQATAEKEITAKADQYSLASVLYEMLTGNPPHTGATAQQIIMKIITEPAEPVTKWRKNVPPHVAAAVSTALEKLSADRFENMKAFADALRDANYTSVNSASGANRARASVLGGRGVVLASCALTVVAIGVAVAGWRRPPAPSPQVVRFTMSMRDGETLAEPVAEAPFALSPDGTKLAYFASDSGSSVSRLHVRSLDQFASTSLRGTERGWSPFFSPDGLWVGFVTAQRELRKLSVTGGPVTTLATGLALYRGAPSWGDDHNLIYPGEGAGPIWRVSDAGGTATRLLDSSRVAGLVPFLLPGNQTALYGLCPANDKTPNCFVGDLGIIDLSARTARVLVPGATRGWYLPSGHLIYATTDGALLATTFDVKSLKVTGAPVKVLDGLATTANGLPAVSISASGTLAYLPSGSSSGNRVVVQRDRSGREEPIISKVGHYRAPRLSPDGQRIAVVDEDSKRQPQIWIHDRASFTTRQLTFVGSNERPSWSPDGRRVAFSTSQGSTRTMWPVWSAPADGSNPGAREGEGPGTAVGIAAVSWTRDGKWIITDGAPENKDGPGGEDIFAIPTFGSPRTMRAVVASAFTEESGEVSPDGKWITYVLTNNGQSQIFIQPFLTPGGQTLVSSGRGTEPVWLSNNELAYVNNETDSLTVARLTFGTATTVTRTALFDMRNYVHGTRSTRNYDVSRDGTHFLFVKPLASKVVEPIVVLNWLEEVKRLLAAAGQK